jgi:N-acetylglucosaminyl-diphospho-decaprenol L-rhamnosyltransferase
MAAKGRIRMAPPDISVIIVSWNTRALLHDCLTSIEATRGPLAVEVIVVDSASSDGTVEMLRNEFPWVIALPQPDNVGFTRGNNIGLARATGRLLFLLNPDTVLLDGCLPGLAGFLGAHPEAGIAGPHTLNPDGTHQPTRRRFPTVLTGLFESTWLQPLAPKRILDHYYVRDAANDAVVPVDWVQGSALMARREVYEHIGGLDERFVMYSEELDWCRRAKTAGFGVYYVGTARMIHHGGQSTAQTGTRSQIHFQQSKVRYFAKHHGLPAALAIRAGLTINYLWQLGLESAKYLLNHKRDLRAERMRGYRHVLRALWGRP